MIKVPYHLVPFIRELRVEDLGFSYLWSSGNQHCLPYRHYTRQPSERGITLTIVLNRVKTPKTPKTISFMRVTTYDPVTYVPADYPVDPPTFLRLVQVLSEIGCVEAVCINRDHKIDTLLNP